MHEKIVENVPLLVAWLSVDESSDACVGRSNAVKGTEFIFHGHFALKFEASAFINLPIVTYHKVPGNVGEIPLVHEILLQASNSCFAISLYGAKLELFSVCFIFFDKPVAGVKKHYRWLDRWYESR